MKTLLTLTAIFCLFSFSSQAWERQKEIKGSGNVKSEERTLGSFNAIEVSQAIEVRISQGVQTPLIVEADDNLLSYIQTEVKGNTLRIFLPSNTTLNSRHPMLVKVTVPDLTSLRATTAGKIETASPWNLTDLQISGTTAAQFDLDVKADRISIELTTAAKAELEGDVKELKIDMTTAAKLDTDDLIAKSVDITASTAARAEIRVEEELEYDVSTGASVKYKGFPRTKGTANSGGSISQEK